MGKIECYFFVSTQIFYKHNSKYAISPKIELSIDEVTKNHSDHQKKTNDAGTWATETAPSKHRENMF